MILSRVAGDYLSADFAAEAASAGFAASAASTFLAAEQAALGLDLLLDNLRSSVFLLLFRLALGCALCLLGAAAFLGVLGFHFHLVLAAALANLREVEVERKDDEHVGRAERDVADPRGLPRAGEPRQRDHKHRGDQDDPPKAAQALVFRCGRIVVLAVELVLLGALGLGGEPSAPLFSPEGSSSRTGYAPRRQLSTSASPRPRSYASYP